MNIEAVRHRALQGLRPPPAIPLADWIEGHVFLPQTASAMPGRMRLWPYQRGICDALDDPLIERITVLKSARIGYTQLLSGIIGSFTANAPCPILAVQPTADDARDYSVELEALFDASPALRGLLSDDADERGRSTMLNRRFPGGGIKFVAARSPRNLRRHTAKVLILDEVDGYDTSAEGDPIELAMMRTQTFRDRKIIAGSTPIFDHGPVTRLYAQSDQRVWECRCPSCLGHSELRWADIRWTDGDPDSAHWVCPLNGCVIEERHKPEMVEHGRWRATAPEVAGHAGFRINALSSPHHNARWSRLVAEFLKAKNAPETLQTFTNLVLGEPWRAEGEELDEGDLASRAERWGLDAVPAEVLAVTAGCDVQHDRLEVVLVGWGEDGTAFILGHRVIWGQWDAAETWADLDETLRARFPHALGGRIGIDAAAIDAGDGVTMGAVLAFTTPRSRRRVVAIKGADGAARPIIERKASKTKTGHRLFIVGVDAAKTWLMARAARGNALRFSADLPPIWFEQFASERAVVRYRKGAPIRSFERIPGKRAEALDCAVYALAARQLIAPDWERRRAELAQLAPLTARPGPVLKSTWMERER